MYLLWRPGGQYVLEQVDSVELEQLALLFSRLDTDHDGVLMFGEFLPLHLPRISLVSPSCLPLISFVSPSYLPLTSFTSLPSPGEFCQFILLVSRWLPAHYTEKELRHMFQKADLNGELLITHLLLTVNKLFLIF